MLLPSGASSAAQCPPQAPEGRCDRGLQCRTAEDDLLGIPNPEYPEAQDRQQHGVHGRLERQMGSAVGSIPPRAAAPRGARWVGRGSDQSSRSGDGRKSWRKFIMPFLECSSM